MPYESSAAATVLVVEERKSLAERYQRFLGGEPVEVVHAGSGRQAMAALDRLRPDAVLLNPALSDMDGLDLLRRVGETRGTTGVIVVMGDDVDDRTREAVHLGRFESLTEPVSPERLAAALRNALRREPAGDGLPRPAGHGSPYLSERDVEDYYGFIGSSPSMQEVYRVIERAAASKATVFIIGESGTGKDLCAGAIHQRGDRADKPFIDINCGAIPKDLMESQIFGHVRGAFTGAIASRAGAATMADGGTLFLDEICELDLDLQKKLLQFIQTGSYMAVGGTRVERADIRFICATNRDPFAEVAAGRFREDLFYRLHVIPIHLPPLRERGRDVLTIARRHLFDFAREEGKGFRRLSPETERVFLAYDWPGNVRQLQNVVRNMVVLHDGKELTADMLPSPLDRLVRNGAGADRAIGKGEAARPDGNLGPANAGDGGAELRKLVRPLAEVEAMAIRRAVELCRGNVARAADLLGISASTIYRKRRAWHGASSSESRP